VGDDNLFVVVPDYGNEKVFFSFKTNTFKIERTQNEKHSISGSLVSSGNSNRWKKYGSIISVSRHVFFGEREAVHTSITENSEYLRCNLSESSIYLHFLLFNSAYETVSSCSTFQVTC
jgi:hypothetical protein